MQALPFGNSVFAIDLEGRYIIEMLEHSVKDGNSRELAGKFLQMSGTSLQTLTVPLFCQTAMSVSKDTYGCSNANKN